jgi:hypothetical protein
MDQTKHFEAALELRKLYEIIADASTEKYYQVRWSMSQVKTISIREIGSSELPRESCRRPATRCLWSGIKCVCA